MPFKTDAGGIALKINDAKLTTSKTASTWNTRLSQIAYAPGEIIICTYSLPDMDYLKSIFDKRSSGITIIAHEKFRSKSEKLKAMYPALNIVLRPDVHAKFVLIEPKTVWLSSANFGKSSWFEQTIGLHSKEAYDFMLEQVQHYISSDATAEHGEALI